ncbi:homeobox domain-containing protein 9 [Vairimorpha necatrix]|uniref:Homeobox domain-containing protein 9 n=1 Tax=Vairimorpha necatrix TaxID=6039 RepID=A0AAX4JBK3_9MICR
MDIKYSKNEDEKYVEALFGLLRMRKDKKVYPKKLNFTRIQLFVLKKIFRLTVYPSKDLKNDIASILNLSTCSIDDWFVNERKLCLRPSTTNKLYAVVTPRKLLQIYNDALYIYLQ